MPPPQTPTTARTAIALTTTKTPATARTVIAPAVHPRRHAQIAALMIEDMDLRNARYLEWSDAVDRSPDELARASHPRAVTVL